MTLASRLIDRIRKSGPLTVAHYMEVALLDPEFGYYATREPFGAAGDFITAPEISQIFGEIIGVWAADCWPKITPELTNTALLELGPGKGTLMRDALRATKAVPGFHQALSVHLVEASSRLQAVQADVLNDLHPHIFWHSTLAELPPLPSIVIANEFFDALPIRQFQYLGGEWRERIVVEQSGRLAFSSGEAVPAQQLPLQGYGQPHEGDIIEIGEAALHVLHVLCMQLLAVSGVMLIIDYGYRKPGFGDTLQAVKNHQFHDVLQLPGEADLTAHVNFSALANAASACGCKIFGPTTQGEFLRRLGAELRATKLCLNATGAQREQILSGLERLMAPHEMGDLFKVMAVAAPYVSGIEGFG